MKRAQISSRRWLRPAFSAPLSGMDMTSVRFSASMAWTVIWSGSPEPIPMMRIFRKIRSPALPRRSIPASNAARALVGDAGLVAWRRRGAFQQQDSGGRLNTNIKFYHMDIYICAALCNTAIQVIVCGSAEFRMRRCVVLLYASDAHLLTLLYNASLASRLIRNFDVTWRALA